MIDPALIGAVAGFVSALGIGGIVVALINKRPDPFAQAQAIIDALQEERKVDSDKRVLQDAKIDKVYESLGAYRTYSAEWELWHAAGCPDPPGQPVRPVLLGHA